MGPNRRNPTEANCNVEAKLVSRPIVPDIKYCQYNWVMKQLKFKSFNLYCLVIETNEGGN